MFARTGFVDPEGVIARMRRIGDPAALKGMARYGIETERSFGVSVPAIRSLARELGKNHSLAQGLWKTGYREARILAPMIDEPMKVTEAQMESWVADFDSWDVCDGCCGTLFDKSPLAYRKAVEWSKREEEFVKRAGYVMMAELAVHDKKAPDSEFTKFFGRIFAGSKDERNFVKKAVNWALRQIGKRNLALNKEALALAERISKIDSSSARWVASDAMRELSSEKVRRKLRRSS